MMERIFESKPIDYTDLIKKFEKTRSMSQSYTKRRSFVLNSKEETPKISLSI